MLVDSTTTLSILEGDGRGQKITPSSMIVELQVISKNKTLCMIIFVFNILNKHKMNLEVIMKDDQIIYVIHSFINC